MTKTDSTKVMWRVEARLRREGKWASRGTFETRDRARFKATIWRMTVGFGNTRVVRVVKGA